MAWYFVTLIVIAIVLAVFFVVTFLMYITNADMKLVAFVYDKVLAYHDKKDVDEKL